MPYIKEENRAQLDGCIEDMMYCLRGNVSPNTDNPHSNPYKEKLTNDEFLTICGDINYAFSRIISGVMGDVSYPKIAIITGVLENIKQEFYRRIASVYEDQKIIQNGDIPEYKRRS
jgi:hypothetical protein